MFNTFQNDQDIVIHVSTQWDTLNAMQDETEIDGIVTYNGAEWKSDIRLRGRNRRMSCDSMLLPFRLQFKKKQLAKAELAGFRNHKVVTPCLNKKEGIDNLQEEMLIYEMYRLFTDSSFMVVKGRLIRSWPEERQEEDEIPILIIEPNNELFARLGGTEIELPNYPVDSLDPWTYNMTALFQFMIGNFDWDQKFRRNIKLIKIGDKAITVPYDFDYAAIVAAPYVKVPIEMGISTRSERVYLGEYFFEELPEIEQHFLSKKELLLQHVSDFPGLKNSRRKQIVKYLEKFYDFIEDSEHTLAYKTVLR